MKFMTLVLCCALVLPSFATTAEDIVLQSPVKVDRYTPPQENTLLLSVNFGEDLILNAQDRKVLKEKTILAIELVYSQYKGHPSFDQSELNANRINQLTALIPAIGADEAVEWMLVEQSGAATREEAVDLFHGFVIHFDDDLAYRSLKKELASLTIPMTAYTLQAEEGGIILHPSGTQITIAPHSLRLPDGTMAQGEVEILYREFRDQADIAFSGIPMTYIDGKTEYNFSSVGMFEIRGNQDGEPLEMTQPATIDFQTTEGKPDVAFYQLDDTTGIWTKNQDINGAVDVIDVADAVNMDSTETAEYRFYKRGLFRGISGKLVEAVLTIENDTINLTRPYADDTVMYGKWEDIMQEDPTVICRAMNKKGKTPRKEVVVGEFGWPTGRGKLFANVPGLGAMKKGEGDRRNGSLLTGSDAGHTFPSMVRGLLTKDFGVYNCDQIYRTKSPVEVRALYTDALTGQAIRHGHVLCMIDLDYNGSFSFNPRNFVCSANGNNALALYTKDKKLYVLSATDFKAKGVTRRGMYTFEMTEMTDQITNTDELRKWLGI